MPPFFLHLKFSSHSAAACSREHPHAFRLTSSVQHQVSTNTQHRNESKSESPNPKVIMESDDSADVPLSVVQNRITNHHPTDQPSDDEDDVPLSNQVPTLSRLKKRRGPKPPSAIQPQSDSDDDIPLASKLKKPHRSTSRPSVRKTAASRRTSDANAKTRKVAKRAPRAKKEEDAPTRKFEKLGQRRETPPENDPTRLFYQSMYHEKLSLGKKSFTAESWMLRNGLLDDRVAENIMARWDLKK